MELQVPYMIDFRNDKDQDYLITCVKLVLMR